MYIFRKIRDHNIFLYEMEEQYVSKFEHNLFLDFFFFVTSVAECIERNSFSKIFPGISRY